MTREPGVPMRPRSGPVEHAEPTITLTGSVKDRFRNVQAEPVEVDVKWEPPSPPKGVRGWAWKWWPGMRAKRSATLPGYVKDGFRYVPVEPDEGDVQWAFPSPLPSPLPAKMVYAILEGEFKAMRESLAYMSVYLDVAEKTLHDGQTRVTSIF